MAELSKGANIAVTAQAVRACLFWNGGDDVPDVDASALLLRTDGRVGSDADFIFYNQTEHESGSVKHAGKLTGPQSYDVIDVDLVNVPDQVDRIALAASADGGTFGAVPGLRLAISDLATSAEIATFAMSADAETAFVTGELYRRDTGWKFRAIGQGYSSGLAGLAADFGIDVGDDAAQREPAEHADEAEFAAPPLPPRRSRPPPLRRCLPLSRVPSPRQPNLRRRRWSHLLHLRRHRRPSHRLPPSHRPHPDRHPLPSHRRHPGRRLRLPTTSSRRHRRLPLTQHRRLWPPPTWLHRHRWPPFRHHRLPHRHHRSGRRRR